MAMNRVTHSDLAGFERLSESVYFHKQTSQSLLKEGRAPSPGLILFLSWGGANIRNISKYTSRYSKDVFPDVPILLVRTEFRHILLHRPTSQDKPLGPVLSILQDQVDKERTGGPGLLVHAFSNGGSYKLMEITKRYQKAFGACLPIQTIIFDSAPGEPSISRSVKAISYALPKCWYIRLPGAALIWISLLVLRLAEALLGREGLMSYMRRIMNDPRFIDPMSKRSYVYSPEDELVGWKDVQDHAQIARSAGYDAIEEMFKGSQHVAHARHDPDRYWSIVKREWNRSSRR